MTVVMPSSCEVANRRKCKIRRLVRIQHVRLTVSKGWIKCEVESFRNLLKNRDFWDVTQNPSLSAILRFPIVSGCRKTRAIQRLLRAWLSSAVSRGVLLSHPEWGEEWGNGCFDSRPVRRTREAAMARTGKLSAVEVAKAKGPAVLHDGGGLYLRISPTGSKAWVFRFQIEGKRRDMGLGPYPDVTVAKAREKAVAHRAQSREGADPIAAKRAERQAQRLTEAKGRTFREIAEEYIGRNEAGWRNAKHRQQWRNTLATYVYPVIGDLPVAAVDAGLVVQLLDPIWATKPETASRVRGRIEAILDAATVRGYRQGPNPAQWKGNLAHILPARAKVRRVAHHAALPFDELPEFLAALRKRPGMAARALEFAILTAARTGEALGATWGEINTEAKVWTVPAARMKAGREHRVPLSAAALDVLDRVRPLALMTDGKPDPAAPVFPGPRRALPMSNMVLLMLLRRMGREDLTAHGFRSSFSDWAAERTAYPREVVEMALAHAIGNKVEAAYRRGDLFEKRRQLTEAWGRFCTVPAASGDVVPMHAGA
jgi:integrase